MYPNQRATKIKHPDEMLVTEQHREALLKAAATRVMSVLDTATEKDHWLAVKNKASGPTIPAGYCRISVHLCGSSLSSSAVDPSGAVS